MNMHQCTYCSESFFSGYSLVSHMRIHNKGKLETHNGSNAFPGFPPPGLSQSQVMDYSWPQNNWQWNSNSTSAQSNQSQNVGSSSSSSSSSKVTFDEPKDMNNISRREDSNSSSSTSSDTQKRKLYECQNCKKVFRSYPGLRYHRNSQHTQDGPYKCNFCEKRFCQKSHLSRHETLHTGEKQYACSYCDKMFRIKGNLQIHLRIHTGEKPYSCKSCGKKFTQQQSAKSHERLHSKYK